MEPNEYDCPECGGFGTAECECCGGGTACDHCDGSGLDPDKIDVEAFVKAERELIRETGSHWEWREDGKVKGRHNGKRGIAYSDFLIQRK